MMTAGKLHLLIGRLAKAGKELPDEDVCLCSSIHLLGDCREPDLD